MLKWRVHRHTLCRGLDLVPQPWSAGWTFLGVGFPRKSALTFLFSAVGKYSSGNKSVLILIYFFFKTPSLEKDKNVILFLRKHHIPWHIQSELRDVVVRMHLVISSREAARSSRVF